MIPHRSIRAGKRVTLAGLTDAGNAGKQNVLDDNLSESRYQKGNKLHYKDASQSQLKQICRFVRLTGKSRPGWNFHIVAKLHVLHNYSADE
jgi:hypothetical protein